MTVDLNILENKKFYIIINNKYTMSISKKEYEKLKKYLQELSYKKGGVDIFYE